MYSKFGGHTAGAIAWCVAVERRHQTVTPAGGKDERLARPGMTDGRDTFRQDPVHHRASRGIGLAIGLRCARDGANVAIAAKTAVPNPKLPGTIYSAAEEIEKAGGKALPLTVDVRDDGQVREALERTAATFGGLDIVVNNASALSLTDSQATDMKRFDLMHQINARGTFMASKFAVPYLEKAANPHILMLSPPLDLKEKWFAPNTAYAMAKYGMSLVVLGLAGELRGKRIAVNALWPRTTIATSAIKKFRGDAVMRASRTPDILADAAHAMFLKDAKTFTGNFLIDDTFLFANGVRDFDRYRVDPGVDLEPDFFVPDDLPPVSLKKAAG
jgi:citronellol/citronellal dehydrogenase